MRNRSDDELMEAYATGDRDAFTELFARLAPRVHGFFLRSFGRREVADDLLQTTFLKVHAGRASFQRGSAVRPWIFGIAARVRIDELRRRYRVPETMSDDGIAERSFDPDPRSPEGDEVARRVRAAIDALPDGQRVVLLLHRYEGMTFREIGDAIGAAEGAVRVRAFRAMATLREKLADLAAERGER